jgi:hypothetical protein
MRAFVLLLVLSLWSFVFATHDLAGVTFSPFDSPEFCSQIITSTCNTTFNYIDELNTEIRPYLVDLVRTEYFKHFKLNLDKQCKFWNAQHFCATENCAVEILSPEQFNWSTVDNDAFKPSKLGQIAIPETTDSLSPSNVPETCEDLDYCHIDDDHQCVFVNLLENPERFTGYGGSQSFDVWKAIYSENCFPNTNPMSMVSNEKEQCVEKNLFYRMVSGMHASIAVHLSNEYLDGHTGEFYRDLKVFMERVGSHNDRLANIYFNYALVSQALVKLNKILPLSSYVVSGQDDIAVTLDPEANSNHNVSTPNTNFEFNNGEYDTLLNNILPSLLEHTLFNTSTLFDPTTTDPNLKNEFRSRFKNISAIMDCVGCDRCRMWGKLQTIGYGTVLKILFETDVDQLKFRRIEIVALINTFDRLSKSVEVINIFKGMYADHLNQVKLGKAQPGEYDTKPKHEGIDFPFNSAFDSQELPHSSSKLVSNKQPKKIAEPVDESTEESFGQTLKREFDSTMHEVIEAVKFVIMSYVTFPKTVAKFGLLKLNIWWNAFIGAPHHNYYGEVGLSEEQEYLNFISE